MSAASEIVGSRTTTTTAIEGDFPIVEVSALGEQESWRKEVNRPIYHIHKWWATRLGSVFRAITLGALSPPQTDVWREFYRTHNFTGKVVLDPFMGSGTTLGEALKLGAKAIGSDVNPVSTFLVQQAFTKVPEESLREAFARLESTVAPEIRRYYQTRDPDTGLLIPVLYFFWCKTVTTPLGDEVSLLSRYVFAQDAYPKKKPRAQIVCPGCWGIFEERYDSTAVTCPHCAHYFNPQKGPADGYFVTASGGERYRIKALVSKGISPPRHRLYAILGLRDNGEKLYLRAGPEDQALFAEAEARLRTEVLPLPHLAVRSGHNTDQARGYNYAHWRDFFNARQLLCLGLLLRGILELEDEIVQEQLLCLFSSTLEFNNLFCSYKGEGTGAVRHMFSNHILKPERAPLENSVWGTARSSGTFSTLFESRLLRAKRYLEQPFELELTHDIFNIKNGTRKTIASEPLDVTSVGSWEELLRVDRSVMILNGDSAVLPVPDRSVDAVVTDPPYFDFVHYSELSDFFFAWLAPVLSNRYPWMKRRDSSDPGEVQHKNPRIFANLLARVLAECGRVLKDDGVLAFSFHHSRAEGWAAIYEALEHAGLCVVAAHPVHAEMRGSSPKNAAASPISIDAILVCKKYHHSHSTNLHTMASPESRAARLVATLSNAGLRLSSSDHFVIAASQLLIDLGPRRLTFDAAEREIEALRARVLAPPQEAEIAVMAEPSDKEIASAAN